MNDNVSSGLPVAKPLRAYTEIRAPLNFIRRQDTKPVFHSAALTGGVMKFLFDPEAHTVAISDMREIVETLSVDREGFELLRHETAVEDLYDNDAVEQAYLPEIEALLRRKFGASQVVVFDVTRRSDGADGAQNPDGLRGPASRLHVDYTVKSGPRRAKDILGEDVTVRMLTQAS